MGSLGVIISPFQNGEIGSYRYVTSVVGPNILAGSPVLIWDLKDHLILGRVRFLYFQTMYIYIYNNIYTVIAFSIAAPVPFYTYFFTVDTFPHHF